MYQKVETARLLVWKSAWEADQGMDPTIAASVAKLYATEAALEVANEAHRDWVSRHPQRLRAMYILWFGSLDPGSEFKPNVARFMERQAQISPDPLEAKIGSVQRCLVDALDGELAIARSMADAPEIDGLVQIQNGFEAGLKPGEFVDVEIMGSDEHDLYGEVVFED